MITFIVPSYNQGEFIKYTLDSILANMSPDDQLIIADGASKDCTADVVSSYLSDSRIEWFSEPDRGFSDAMSKAFQRVRNPIIGIMSSDDAYMPGICDRVVECFNDPGVVLVYADYELMDTENRKIGERHHIDGNLSDILSLRVLLPQSSVFFLKSALAGQKILDLAHDYIADVVLFNQVCIQGRFRFIPEILSRVRQHSGSRTGKRNPGEQYLNAIESALADMPVELKDKARAGGLLLQSRYQASSPYRFKALSSLMAALSFDPMLVNHWLLPRTLAYIVLGHKGVRLLVELKRRILR